MNFELEPLPYAIDALEPHISATTVETHYTKHHQSYMDKVKNTLTGKPAAEKKPRRDCPNRDRRSVQQRGTGVEP